MDQNQRQPVNKLVGQAIPRKEGSLKLTGRSRYIDDIHFPGEIFGTTVRSTVARGKIKKIHFPENIPWKEFTVVTAKDLPGKNAVALILDDQPYLADEDINHPEEPILLLAHPNRYLLEEARKSIKIDYEELPGVFTIQDSLSKKDIIWGKDNVFKSYLLEKGNVDSVWKNAFKIIEGEYQTGAQEQLYIENNGMIATANPTDGVTVWGSMQCPYYIHKALCKLFPLEPEKIRIIQAETGGGFGGKEEYPSMIAGHAALLAWKSGKPVRLIYDRAEDMAATTKRHPSITRHRTAVTQEGKILAEDIEFLIDGGAYATLSAVVLSRGTIHAAGPYHCDNVRIRAKALATNHPPHGAFRGFGAPQSIFGLERHLNVIAKELNISPEDIRRRNFLTNGSTTATGQTVRDGVDMNVILDQALKEANFSRKQKEIKKHNQSNSPIKKGIGFATFFHGSGFTGSGERNLASVVGIEATPTGNLRVLSASTEIGQGTNTIFSQIAADAIGINFDDIEVFQPDTKHVPNSGPTVASRTCMVVGKLVETAARKIRDILIQSELLKTQYTPAEFKEAVLAYRKKFGELKTFSQYKEPPNIFWDDEKYQGDAYGTYAWAAYVAEVSIDTRTWEINVDHFVAHQDVGKVVHPILASGQIEGGVAQGIGYSIWEKVVWNQGQMKNNQMTNYIMGTSQDVPPITVTFAEHPYAFGPQGAKGIGELPMDGPAPAILNAVEDALGVSCNAIPLLPEDLARLVQA